MSTGWSARTTPSSPAYVAKRVFLEAFTHPMEPRQEMLSACNELFERGANLDLLQFVLEVSCMQMKSRLTPNDIKPELCTLLMKDAAIKLEIAAVKEPVGVAAIWPRDPSCESPCQRRWVYSIKM